jgi:type IV pilus assembly protein PilA
MSTGSALRRSARDERGFTLVELLVVMVVIGVLLAIAVPSYIGFTARARVTASAADVREATPAAEAYFIDNQTYNGISAAQLKTIDAGISSNLQTVKAESGGAGYCISAKVGSAWAHLLGPGGQVVTNETADNCP